MSRRLKHYNAYLSRLLAFSDALGLKVEFAEDVPGEGLWMPAGNKIKIDDNMTQSDTIATILHELGHSVSDLPSKPYKLEDKLSEAYQDVYAGINTDAQLNLVIREETRAWSRGRDIATRLKIRLGRWYDAAEKESIKEYEKQ